MDLINDLNSKMGNRNAEVKKPVTTEVQPERGTDLIKESKGTAPAEVSQKVVSKEEPTSTENSTNTETWTTESALKEIKKLREENKQVRLKYEDTVSNLKKELDDRVHTIESKYQPLTEAAKELEELKKKEEDKKRDITEKLAHREALLAEAKARNEAIAKDYQNKVTAMEAKLAQFEAEKQAQAEVYRTKLTEELNSIPEKFKGVADLLVRGAGDPRDALVALGEAKIRGMFEDKTVVVNHGVPGARDGARTTNETLLQKQREELDKLTGVQKIGAALKQMKQGETNSAFKANLKK